MESTISGLKHPLASEKYSKLQRILLQWVQAAQIMFRLAGRLYRREITRFARRQPLSLSTAKMDPGQPFEEEQLPWYRPDQFYPVRIGEILDSKYKVLGKLGYGAHSTVWLCRNIRYIP